MSTDAHTAAGTPAEEPRGELAVRTLAMPADTYPSGDIFGGWLMSLMDVAGGIAAGAVAQGRVATVAATDMTFLRPVKVGDVVCCYTDLARAGRTSLTFRGRGLGSAPAARRPHKGDLGRLHYVALDDDGRPRPGPCRAAGVRCGSGPRPPVAGARRRAPGRRRGGRRAAGDRAEASPASSTRSIELDAFVWSNNTVRVLARNASGGAFDLGAATPSVAVVLNDLAVAG